MTLRMLAVLACIVAACKTENSVGADLDSGARLDADLGDDAAIERDDAGADAGGPADAGSEPDAGAPDASCASAGPEVCNGRDDDCDAITDEHFDTARCGIEEWAHRLDGSRERRLDYGVALAFDPAGNLYVIGNLTDGADFGDGPYAVPRPTVESPPSSMFVASYAPDGTLRWHREYSEAEAVDCAWSSDGDLVVAGDGGPSGSESEEFDDAFIARFASDGTLTTTIEIAGENFQSLRGLAVRGDRIYVTGLFQEELVIGATRIAATGDPSNDEGFLAALDSTGAPRWIRPFQTAAGNESGLDVAVDGDGSVGLLGTFDEEVEIGGATVSLARARAFPQPTFLAMFDAAGALAWAVPIDRPSFFYHRGALAMHDGLLVALVQGPPDSEDTSALAFDAGGVMVWSQDFANGSFPGNTADGLTFGPTGDLWVTGSFRDEIAIGGLSARHAYPPEITMGVTATDGFAVHLARETGGARELFTFGLASIDGGRAIAIDGDRIAIAGTAEDSGFGPLIAAFLAP
jgi:hypothetical protein